MMSQPYFTEQVVRDHQQTLLDRAASHRLAKDPSDAPSPASPPEHPPRVAHPPVPTVPAGRAEPRTLTAPPNQS